MSHLFTITLQPHNLAVNCETAVQTLKKYGESSSLHFFKVESFRFVVFCG